MEKVHIYVNACIEKILKVIDNTLPYLIFGYWVLWVLSELNLGIRYSGAYKQWVAFSNLLSCSLCGSFAFFIQWKFLSLFSKKNISSHFQRIGIMCMDKDNEMCKIIFIELFLSVSFTVRTPATKKVSARCLLNIPGISEHIFCPNHWMDIISLHIFSIYKLETFYILLIGGMVLDLQND